jgi:hypothetical protein
MFQADPEQCNGGARLSMIWSAADSSGRVSQGHET